MHNHLPTQSTPFNYHIIHHCSLYQLSTLSIPCHVNILSPFFLKYIWFITTLISEHISNNLSPHTFLLCNPYVPTTPLQLLILYFGFQITQNNCLTTTPLPFFNTSWYFTPRSLLAFHTPLTPRTARTDKNLNLPKLSIDPHWPHRYLPILHYINQDPLAQKQSNIFSLVRPFTTPDTFVTTLQNFTQLFLSSLLPWKKAPPNFLSNN